MDINEAMAALGISRRRIGDLIAQGVFTTERVPAQRKGRWKLDIPNEQIDQYKTARRPAHRPPTPDSPYSGWRTKYPTSGWRQRQRRDASGKILPADAD